MTWVRIEEGFTEHPKVIAAGSCASWLHICALCYANRQLTDGFIPSAVLPRLSNASRPAALAEVLVKVGLWEIVEGGWTIHDYLLYQPTRAEVEATKERTYTAKAEAGRLGGLASGVARRKHNRSKPEPNGQAEGEQIEARSDPTRTSTQVSDNSTPTDTLLQEGGTVDIRRNQVADHYARIAIEAAKPPPTSPDGYRRTARQTALNHPDLTRYLTRWPTAPADAIAAWLHGDKHSMGYYPDAEDQLA